MATYRPKPPAPDNGALKYNAGIGAQDPSALTTQQLVRENFWLRELLEARMGGIEERIDAGDKAVSLLQAFTDRTPTTKDVQHEVIALREVVMEKFASINTTFSQNDKALTAALQAQEKQAIATNDSNNKAISKMEDNFTNLIEQGRELLIATKSNTDVQINDIKSRLDKGEGSSGGVDKTWGVIAVVATLVIAGTVAFVNRSPSAVTPQVIYVPTPVVPTPNNLPPAVAR